MTATEVLARAEKRLDGLYRTEGITDRLIAVFATWERIYASAVTR